MKLTIAAFSTLALSSIVDGAETKLQENAECWVRFTGGTYVADGDKCDNSKGLDCNYHIDDNGTTPDRVMGYCEITKCMGHNNKDPPAEGTSRITICHRTCSKTNPWVRVTIDENAWADQTQCGHGINHDIWEDCKATAEEAALYWGGKTHDYEIITHGTREEVRLKLRSENPKASDAEIADLEKAYWATWEPACPYVRNGQCCDAENGECCGEFDSTGGGGDPHFKRWGQKHDTFHGECDLVLAHSDQFLNGAGLDFHARTTIQEYFSYIETAALRVGDSVMEFYNDYFLVNGNMYTPHDLPLTIGEDFTLLISNYVEAGKPTKNHQNYQVHMGGSSSIILKFYKQLMSYNIVGEARDLGDSVGIMGSYHNGAMVSRDGDIMTNFQEFAFEWQVNPSDVRLFREARQPQLPYEKCRLPTAARPSRRKLRASDKELLEKARKACANASNVNLCIDDVIMTQDLGLAETW